MKYLKIKNRVFRVQKQGYRFTIDLLVDGSWKHITGGCNFMTVQKLADTIIFDFDK